MPIFFLIPAQELTQAMVLKSTSTSSSTLPVKVISNVSYYVLEVDRDVLRTTDVFNLYRPYDAKELDTATPFIPSQFRKFVGALSDSVTTGQTKSATYTFAENRYITGINFRAFSPNVGDKITVEVLDANDVLINTICKDWFIDDSLINNDIQKTLVIAGVKLKVTYTNTGLVTVNWFLNLKLWSQ